MTNNTQSIRKIVLLTSLGGVLEFYDFIIYMFLAPLIEEIFFAHNSPLTATLKTFAIFSISYLTRPLGGLIFAHFGDRYGRKVVFLATVILMAIPSFGIGLLPTPEQIGIFSPVLLLILRMIQGLALGGEIPAAITFISEHVAYKQQGKSLAILYFGINSGLLLGSLVATLLSTYFSHEALLAYAWRIPFILGGFFGLISIYLRRYLHETAIFTAIKPEEVKRIPALTLIREARLNVLCGMALVATGSITVFFYLYWPQYLNQYLNYNLGQMMQFNTLSTFALNVFIIAGGILTDYIGARRTYLIATASLAILAYPLFTLFTYHTLFFVAFAYSIFSLIFGFIPAAYSVLLAQLFPPEIRYSGIALSYNLAYAFLGGLSPFFCTLAIYYFNSVLAPAFYILIVAIFSFGTCYLLSVRKSSYIALPTKTKTLLQM